MGLNPFLTFYIDVDANANVKCEHTFTVMVTESLGVNEPLMCEIKGP